MRLITHDDIIELYTKGRQRGWAYLFSKFNWNASERVKSTFSDEHIPQSAWWIVPGVRKRWNDRITGRPDQEYEDYVAEKFLHGKSDLRMLALGCGIGSHERRFAQFPAIGQVDAWDLSPGLIDAAARMAAAEGITNIDFSVKDVNRVELQENAYDLVLFHMSLHHFYKLEELLGNHLPYTLKAGGLLVINEYVGPNRHQWSRKQLEVVNKMLKKLPLRFRRRFRSSLYKTRMSGPGWLRMCLSDPSEAAESEKIRPLLARYYEPLEEKELGGNLLMLILKDIAHHFVPETPENRPWLEQLFEAEDKLLQEEKGNILFGVYKPT
jgi:SAM-dependent methyltransferase